MRYGNKPEDANPISDFTVTGSGIVWMADPNGITEAYDRNGAHHRALPPSIHAVTLTALDQQLIVQPVATKALPHGDAFLLLVPSDQAAPRGLPSFVRDHERFGMAVSGIPVSGPEHDGFFYITRAAGILAAYTAGGHLKYAVQTISGQGLPGLEITASGATRLPSQGREFVRDVTVHGRLVLTLSDINPNNPLQPDPDSVLDAYDAATGEYLSSVALPFRGRSIAVLDGELYVAANNDISIWDLPDKLE
jgi:hypothetical protein